MKARLTHAERQRRLRARRALGRIVLQIEVDEAAHADMLVETGFLRPELADDPASLRAALQRLVDRLVTVTVER